MVTLSYRIGFSFNCSMQVQAITRTQARHAPPEPPWAAPRSAYPLWDPNSSRYLLITLSINPACR